MTGLFEPFNPCVEIAHQNYPFQWVIIPLVLMLLPAPYFFSSSKNIVVMDLIINKLMESLNDVFKGLNPPGSNIFFISLSLNLFLMNYLGLLPYVFTATSHLSITLSFSLPIWMGYMTMSLMSQFNFNMAHFVPESTPTALMPLMVVIETVSLIIRPLTLGVRLAANLIAGHLLITLLGSMAVTTSYLPLSGVMSGMVVLMLLELAVAAIQMYVFIILSALYLNEHMSLEMNKSSLK